MSAWTPEATFPAVERERITWHPPGAAARFEFALARRFREI